IARSRRAKASAERSAYVRMRVLAPVGLGPRGETLAQPRRARVLPSDALLFVRVAGEVVQLVGTGSKIEDVLPVAFADAELEFVLGDIEIGARRMRAIEEIAP